MEDVKKILEEFDSLREKPKKEEIKKVEDDIIRLVGECLEIISPKIDNKDFVVVNGYIQMEVEDDFPHRIIEYLNNYMFAHRINLEDLRPDIAYVPTRVEDLDVYNEHDTASIDRVATLAVRFRQPHPINNISSIYIDSVEYGTLTILVD